MEESESNSDDDEYSYERARSNNNNNNNKLAKFNEWLNEMPSVKNLTKKELLLLNVLIAQKVHKAL